jgi:hypothetical protein
MISDDRGRRVPLVPHDILMHLGTDPQRSARLRAAADLPRTPPTRAEIWRGVFYGVLALPVMLGVAILPAYFAFNLRLPWWGMCLGVLPMAVLPAMVTVFIARRTAGRRIARIYLHAGYCPSCGYDLQAAPQQSDGIRTCSECGAMWRSDNETVEPGENAAAGGR